MGALRIREPHRARGVEHDHDVEVGRRARASGQGAELDRDLGVVARIDDRAAPADPQAAAVVGGHVEGEAPVVGQAVEGLGVRRQRVGGVGSDQGQLVVGRSIVGPREGPLAGAAAERGEVDAAGRGLDELVREEEAQLEARPTAASAEGDQGQGGQGAGRRACGRRT